MNLFRSEEHIASWLAGRGPGVTLTVTKLCELAHVWWGNRLDPQWHPRTLEQSQAILTGLGLTGPFWSLSGD